MGGELGRPTLQLCENDTVSYNMISETVYLVQVASIKIWICTLNP